MSEGRVILGLQNKPIVYFSLCFCYNLPMAREIPGYQPDKGDFTGFLPDGKLARRQFLVESAKAVGKTLAVATAGPIALAGVVTAAGEEVKSLADKSAAYAVIVPDKLDEYRATSAAIARRDGHRVGGMGRFQLNLDGTNPDWCPRPGLPHPEHKFSSQLEYEISHPLRLVDPETDQELNTIVANRAGRFDRYGNILNSDEPVTVYFGLYRNAVNYRESNLRVGEIAHAMPDRLLFAFDPPAMGDSGNFTKAQKEGMNNGDMTEVVDAHLRILASKGIKRINLAGYSLGSRIALSTALRAKAHGITVDNLMLFEPPGVDKESITLEEALRRNAKENEALDLYHSNRFDPKLFVAAGLNRPDGIRLLESLGFLAEQAEDDPGFAYAYMTAEAKVEAELEQLYEQTKDDDIKTHVSMFQADLSLISPFQDAKRIIDRFQGQYGSRMGMVWYNGVGHFAFAQPKELASCIKRTIAA